MQKQRSTMTDINISIHPLKPVIDEVINIKVSGLSPGSQIQFLLHTIDDSGKDWLSEAVFISDKNGDACTSTSCPISGTYSEVDPMGLFWSMRPIIMDEKTNWFSKKNADPLIYNLEIKSGSGAKNKVRFERCIGSEDIIFEPIRCSDLVADIYRPSRDGKYPAIILIGHSGGGLGISPFARMLARHGFITAAVAYFGIEPLKEQLYEIPLEYFENAVNLLKSHKNCVSSEIGIIGTSKGAEAGLLTASFIPHIKAAAAFMPSSVAFMGIAPWKKGCEKSSWSWRGQPVPFLKFNLQGDLSFGAVSFIRQHIESLKSEEALQACIKVENINAPILLISPEDDRIWPSAMMGDSICARLEQEKFPHYFKQLKYPEAGHMLGGIMLPNTPATITRSYNKAADIVLEFGGDPQKTAYAISDSCNQAINFFRKFLRKTEE